MRTITGWLLVFAMLTAAAPAYSGEALQIFRCEQEDDVTEEEIMATAQEWITAARKTKGGQGLELRVLFPIAVNATGEIDFLLLVSAPSFEQLGAFWDNQHDSEVSDVDEGKDSKSVCPDSALWEVERIAAKAQ